MRRGWGRLLGAGAAAVTVAIVALSAGCGSIDKQQLGEGLLALDRNRRIDEHGLRHAMLDLDLPGQPGPIGAIWLEVPARTRRDGALPVVLVHGTPSTLGTWSDVIFGSDEGPGLAEDFDVYALELVDHGVGPAANGPASFQRCADYLAGFIAALGIGPVALVGQSYGGEFAWRAALDRPDLVERLVLLDSSGYARADEAWLPEERAMRELPGARWGWLLNSRDRIRTALAPHFGERLSEDLVEEVFLLCSERGNWAAMVDLARDENGTRQAEVPSLRQPTLLIWGDRDLAYPVESVARRFERELPDARLHVIEDCGHYPQEERPAATVAALRGFLLP